MRSITHLASRLSAYLEPSFAHTSDRKCECTSSRTTSELRSSGQERYDARTARCSLSIDRCSIWRTRSSETPCRCDRSARVTGLSCK
jgi:hypothetical protein